MYTVVIICGLAAIFSLMLTAKCVLAQRRIQWLAPPSEPVQHDRKICVVIPARNEESDISTAMRSVLGQQGVKLAVVVVNDHSTDRTGDLVEEIARTDARVTVLHQPPLKTGWLGKCNAMQHGAEGATADYLLFTDADIVHVPFCFATVLNELQQNGYDFISLFPRCDNRSLWENVWLAPPLMLVTILQYWTPILAMILGA